MPSEFAEGKFVSRHRVAQSIRPSIQHNPLLVSPVIVVLVVYQLAAARVNIVPIAADEEGTILAIAGIATC